MINYSWLFVTRDQSRFTASGIGGPPYSNRVSSPISKPTKMSADIPKKSSHSVFQGIALVWKPADRKGKVLARPPLSPRMLVSVNWGRGAVSSPSACWLLWWFNFFLLCDVSKEQQASKANFKHKNKHRQHQLNSNEDFMEFVNLRWQRSRRLFSARGNATLFGLFSDCSENRIFILAAAEVKSHVSCASPFQQDANVA